LPVSRDELHDLLSRPSLNGIPLLVLGNKIEKTGTLFEQDFTEQIFKIGYLSEFGAMVRLLLSDHEVTDSILEIASPLARQGCIHLPSQDPTKWESRPWVALVFMLQDLDM
ncbi:hypothetical protein TanjilG_19539, partial [Lupinus angustifolius]